MRGMAYSLELNAVGLQSGEHDVDTQLVNCLQSTGADAEPDEAPEGRRPETLALNVRLEHALGLVVRVRNPVPADGTLSGDRAILGHKKTPTGISREARAVPSKNYT